MTTNSRVAIIARIVSLEKRIELKGDIRIHIPKSGKSVKIIHRRKHVPDLVFAWSKDHFIGYFLNAEGKRQRALLALWDADEAKHFLRWYSKLVALSARRPAPVPF